jgi:hypothetical protein
MKGFTKKRNGQFLAAKRHSLLAGFAVMFIAAIFSFTLLGCSSIKVVDTWMNPTFQKEEHSILIVEKKLWVGYIDTINLPILSGIGVAGESVLLLAPGTHTLEASYSSSSNSVVSGVVSTTTEEASGLKTTYDFLPGRYYLVTSFKSGGMVSINIKDVTDSENKKDKKLVQAAAKMISKQPATPSLPGTLLADSSEITPFEGTWAGQPGEIYIFAGNTIEKTVPIYDPDGTSGYQKFKGRFEYTDNKISLYFLSAFNRETSDWSSLSSKGEYDYTLDDGTLTLMWKQKVIWATITAKSVLTKY